MCGAEPAPPASARLAQQGDLAGPSQCRGPAQQEHAVEPLEESPARRPALAECLQRVGQAEALWGPDDCRTALELRRLALALALDRASSTSSPPARGVPLWLRILEIELPALGPGHPDVAAVRRLVEEELLCPRLDAGVAADYQAQLARICYRRDLDVGDPGAWRAGAGGAWTPADARDRCPSPNFTAAAASVGGVAATEVGGAIGGAVVGAAVRVGLAAASSTCSVAAGVAGQVLGAAAQQAASAAVTAAAPAAAQQPLGWTVRAAGAVGSAAFDTARVTAGASLDVASQVAGAVTSSVAASTFSFAGRHAISGTAYAAQSAWGLVRGALVSPDEVGPAEAASAPAASERPD